MKRTAEGNAVDPLHPSLCFHREVLSVQQWTQIRREFFETLQKLPKTSNESFSWKEPKKLWRHSQEALGKWVLSQVARLNADSVDLQRELFFFPTESLMKRGKIAEAQQLENVGTLAYDEQLLRDLSLKSSASHTPVHCDLLKKTIQSFDLLRRCTEAEQRVRNRMAHVTPHSAFVPVLRSLEEGSKERTVSQQRVKDVVVEITAAPASGQVSMKGRGPRYPVVSITKASLEKLERSYRHFGQAADMAHYGATGQRGALSALELFQRRAATVALRYEGGLSTGSLQLCADTALKQHLHAAGFHVVDLCASPINAYCGVPQEGCFHNSSEKNPESDALHDHREVPNRYCSAFLDTDSYFGSLGSALRVDPFAIYDTCVKEAVQKDRPPLLLTYDVPYDEDLCEKLFLKLEKDLAKASSEENESVLIDYILVLPLWWDLPLRISKSVFLRSAVHVVPVDAQGSIPVPSCSAVVEEVRQAIASRAAMLKDGYQILYQWPQRLAMAVGAPHTENGFLCWDGIFLDEAYRYFCTATNQWIGGVTATEVIALQTPRHDRLTSALRRFFGSEAVIPR